MIIEPKVSDEIIKKSQDYIQLNYARGKFDPDEGKGVRDAIINNLVVMVIQDVLEQLNNKKFKSIQEGRQNMYAAMKDIILRNYHESHQ
jgi:hypothetical protein